MTSQNILKKENRVTTIITKEGDTLIQFKIADAKIILSDILNKKVSDSLVELLIDRDIMNRGVVELQLSEINALVKKNTIKDLEISNNQKMLVNYEIITKELEVEIIGYKKEVKKQSSLKMLGFSAAILLPIIVAISFLIP
jgi:hypothetical protein